MGGGLHNCQHLHGGDELSLGSKGVMFAAPPPKGVTNGPVNVEGKEDVNRVKGPAWMGLIPYLACCKVGVGGEFLQHQDNNNRW